MRNTTEAELANTLAILWVRRSIAWLTLFRFIPKYRDYLTIRRNQLFILLKRDQRIGSGMKSK
jgi:hypothetical protein